MVVQDHLSPGSLVVWSDCHAVSVVDQGLVPRVVGSLRGGSRSTASAGGASSGPDDLGGCGGGTRVVGARSFAAIGEWAADAPQWVLEMLGVRQHRLRGVLVAPHEATMRRTISSFDAELLDAVISAWLTSQPAPLTPQGAPSAMAVDGKTVRGAWRPDGSQVHPLSAISHHSGVVLAQREIAAKTNEIPQLAPLLDGVSTCPVWWSPQMPCIPNARPHGTARRARGAIALPQRSHRVLESPRMECQ